MSELFLSRTLCPSDYTALENELPHTLGFVTVDDPPHRHWEYALALHSIGRWLDAGHHLHGSTCDISIEPRLWTEELPITRLAISADADLAGLPLKDVITSFTTVTQVEDLERYCYHLSCLLAPGGLLILTMEYWDRCGEDRAVGARTRRRIFCPKTYAQLRTALTPLHLTTFGGVDPAYHGRQVHDYTLASLVLEKRR